MTRIPILFIFVGLFLGSCTFAAPQIESSIRLIERLASGKGASVDEPRALWLASVGGQGAVLTPYLSGELTVFANAEGDAIAFDGWTIRSITGFGLSSPVSVMGKDGVRVVIYHGARTDIYCDSWTRAGLSWEQSCVGGRSKITVDETSNIQSITMGLGNKLGFVKLRVVKQATGKG